MTAKVPEIYRWRREPTAEEKRAAIEAKKVRRAEREAELGRKQRESEPDKFGVILANAESDRDAIVTNAAKVCVLIVRCKGPTTKRAMELIEGCGFKYKSNVARRLDHPDDPGPALPLRNAHELFLIATSHGKVVAPAPGTQFASIIEVPIADVVRRYFPSLRKIDLSRRA